MIRKFFFFKALLIWGRGITQNCRKCASVRLFWGQRGLTSLSISFPICIMGIMIAAILEPYYKANNIFHILAGKPWELSLLLLLLQGGPSLSMCCVSGPGLIARGKKVNETSCPQGTPQI